MVAAIAIVKLVATRANTAPIATAFVPRRILELLPCESPEGSASCHAFLLTSY
jgi:hypothetical protein